MLMLYVLIIWKIQAVPQGRFNMYHINDHQDRYCFWSYVGITYTTVDQHDVSIHQTFSYCLRPSEKHNFTVNFGFNSTTDPSFTFVELKEQNITSEMLLGWSASIDLAERYEIFLKSNSNSLFEREILFYNCTSSWFGPLCRFTFDYKMYGSFNSIVNTAFQSKSTIEQNAEVPCYQHLHCQAKLSCLDWREICNGKSECLDGSDENNCWQLEVNQCKENEFRCHNGLCIPIEFFNDSKDFPDCLDRTDETGPGHDLFCYGESHFRCEEHICRPGQNDFSCGDGQCTNGMKKCSNGRTALSKADFCSNATACSMLLYNLVNLEWCERFCVYSSYIEDNCSMLYEFRYIPLLFEHVRLMFSIEKVGLGHFPLPACVCYDEKLCADFPSPTKYFNNFTCRHFNDSRWENIVSQYERKELVNYVKTLFVGCLIPTNAMDYCNYSTMYRCYNSSKCISKQRLLDGIRNCPFNDDETFNQSCSLSDSRQRFKCYEHGHEKCFTSIVILDGKKDCINGEDERAQEQKIIQSHIVFQTICDGKTELLPVLIDGQNETDETECEHWPCNNTYTRCDRFWLCANGADEINCPPSTCPALHHDCVFLNDTSKVSCLPIAKAGDRIDNCLGGTDERKYYSVEFGNLMKYPFHCWNNSEYIHYDNICNNKTDCPFNDDESFCHKFYSYGLKVCRPSLTNVESFLCVQGSVFQILRNYFILKNMKTYPLQLSMDNNSITQSTWTNIRSIQKDSQVEFSSDYGWWCNRGVSIRIRMNDNTSDLYCLCPPSYYGDRCQYQNQRVGLTVQIRVSSDWYTAFIFLITLIDNERDIQAHDRIEYLPIRECRNKFNLYLLYSTRPKNSSKTYSVQIDAFNQFPQNYRASWIFPLQFPFLPVHLLPVLLKVPVSTMEPTHICWSPCIHGQCFAYINDQSSTFCRCEPGWSGVRCDVEYKCDCASDSLCISNSVCLCPPGRFGPRCYLYQYPSYSEPCLNGGYYLSKDIRYVLRGSADSICICAEGYVGYRCEHQQRRTRIDILFHNKLTIPSFVLIHFIDVQKETEPNRTSTMKKIGFDQFSLVLYTLVSFNIALVQMFSEYYLIVLQEQTIVLSNISTEIIPSHRCQPIGELFNQTFANQHLLKRIKYYHIPCKEQLELICFYDDVHFCFCNLNRQANCFEFDHNMDYTCGGSNFCENEGLCFQDDPKCPTPPSCGCNQCYFGSRCQFSTKGSTLSLDTILGYHIRPNTGISQQSITVKVTIAVITFMFAFGLLNSFLAFQTFKEQETRKVGCGLYLFASSIISLIIVIMFTLKFCLFLTSQIDSIQNRLFVKIQCVFMDYFIRCLLSTSDWLSACVAIERAISVSKGINFDKAKSKQMAKWIILIVLLLTSCTYIYDPIHRRLINDEEEERSWCVHKYSSSVQILDWIMNLFHFLVPFSINCGSALIVIAIAARTRSNCQTKKPFREHLRDQLEHHKHLLISPSILILLASPRLVLTFLSGCMKTAGESWFYLIGYFISFVSSMVTFVVFVLPSKIYKKQFNESMKRIWQR